MTDKITNIVVIVLMGIFAASFAGFFIFVTIFYFQGGRFTEADGLVLERRIEELERVQVEKTPVMDYIKPMDDWYVNGTFVSNNFNGFKLRTECDRVPDSEVGYWRDDNAVVYESGFRYVADTTPNSTFKVSVFNIGKILWTAVGIDKAQAVGFTMKHDCDGLIQQSEFWFKLK